MITEWLITHGRFCRWIVKWWRHCDVHPNAIIGYNLKLGHGGFGVVIGNCVIHNNVTIMQGTTIGNRRSGEDSPEINSNVFIGSNCDIIGDIGIGNDVIIGAGSIITKTIPSFCTAYNKQELIIKRTK